MVFDGFVLDGVEREGLFSGTGCDAFVGLMRFGDQSSIIRPVEDFLDHFHGGG